jgi:hypothetical protein
MTGAFRGTVARAQSTDACFEAPVEGQKLERAGKLTAARALFETCSRNTCPAEIVEDCTRWAQRVDAALPSVVLAARDAQGRDVVDAVVSVDGAPAVPLSARAMALDPGAHRFVFRRNTSETVERQVILREAEKNRELAVTFAGASQPAVAPPVATADAVGAPPLLFWVAGGVGVAAIASFGVFGALGVSERSSDDCANGCALSQKNSVDTKLRIADVSLGIGVVALGVATWMYLSRSHADVGRTSSHAPARYQASRTQRAFFDVNPARAGGVAVIGTRF